MPIVRIPLSQPIETRNGYLNTDSKCVNGYFEATNGKREFVKRPGTSTFVTSPTMPTGQGQGLTYFNGNLYARTVRPSPWRRSSVAGLAV